MPENKVISHLPPEARPAGPFGSPIQTWSGYPDYRGTDTQGNVFFGYGPKRR